ncbi:MAG: glycosyltransferase family 2 protein [Candidatus Woesearchaeota archaeon]|nr:glycosyltransferase family 2 protein [Candidatus Woesearchaeota archaeon]
MSKISKKKSPLVSLSILNYNGKELLKIILDSIKRIKYSNFETIVVDNDSKDGSAEFLRKNYPWVKLIKNSRNTGYPALNLAVSKARGKYLLYLNNDMELKPNCIEELIKVIEKDENTAMVSPKLINFYNRKTDFSGTWISRSFYAGYLKGAKNNIREIPYSGCALIRKSAINNLSYLFDPDYFLYGEDVDLGMRLRLIGLKALYVPSSVIYHMERKTTAKVATNSRLVYLMERNLLTTFFKCLSRGKIMLFFPYVFFMRFVAIIRDLLKLDFKSAFSRVKAIFWIIFRIPTIARKRNFVQKKRKVSDRYLLSVFSEKSFFRQMFHI